MMVAPTATMHQIPSTAHTASMPSKCSCSTNIKGNVSKAVKDAAQLLNVTQDPDYEYDKEAIEHGAKVAAQILSKPKKKEQGPLDGLPENLLSVPGILQDVVNYYTVTAIKPQPQFAVQAALAFGSVVMGRRWVTDQRNFFQPVFSEHWRNRIRQGTFQDCLGGAARTGWSG